MFLNHAIAVSLSLLIAGGVCASSPNNKNDIRALPPITKNADLVYPEHSRRLEEEGVVKASFWIERSGRTSRCTVASSSGFPRLDQASCAAISKMTFDASSIEYFGPFLTSIKWRLGEISHGNPNLIAIPDASRGVNRTIDGELPLGRRVNLGLYLQVSNDGGVVECKVQWGSGNSKLDRRACEIASKWRYRLIGDRHGTGSQLHLETFFFADPAARF